MKRIWKITDVITSDLAGAIRPFFAFCLVLSGGVSVIAIGLFISYAILLRPNEGVEAFMAVMSFSGAGLVEPFRRTVEIINWISLLAMGGLCFREAIRYLSSVEERSRPNNVVQFPARKNNSPFSGSGGGIVANM